MNAITLLIDVVGAAVAHTEAICAWFVAVSDEAVSSLMAGGNRSTGMEVQGVKNLTRHLTIILLDIQMWQSCSIHKAKAIIVCVYCRQRTIQNTKQTIKQQRKATLRQDCAQSVDSDGTTFCHFCVFTSQKLAFMQQTSENTSLTTVWCFPKT